MRYLMLILAFPLLVQAQSDSKECGRLREIAAELEGKFQSSFAGAECDSLPDSEFNKFDYRCQNLSAVEMQLKSLETEIAMINGVKNLRTEVIDAKNVLAKAPNKTIAVDASQELYKNLKLAAKIEGFLGASGIQGDNLLSALAQGKDEDFQDPAKFQAHVAATCIKIGVILSTSPICDKSAPMDPDLMAEIQGLLTLGKKTERKFNKSQVDDLKQAMAMKNGDKDYSFNEMLNAVADPKEGAFAPEDVATLATLSIAPDSDKYNFLKKLRTASGNLSSSRDLTHAQGIPARFQSFMTDLKNRQSWEMKSKFAVVLKDLKDDLPAETQATCQAARELNEADLENCFTAIGKDKKIPSYKKRAAENIVKELTIGHTQLKKLDLYLVNCIPDDQMNMSDACQDYTDEALLTLTKKVQELTDIRTKIQEKNQGLMLARDLAIETVMTKQCIEATASDINGCAADLGTISREALVLSDATSEILYMYNTPPVATDVAKICSEIPPGTLRRDELCKLALPKPAESTAAAPVAKKKTFIAPTMDAFARESKPDYSGMFGSLAQSLGSLFMPSQQSINPYGNLYPYSGFMGQPTDIKSQIMSPYMVNGFGSYAATPGLRPYSSINSNVGTASAYSFGKSKYFNSPVGW